MSTLKYLPPGHGALAPEFVDALVQQGRYPTPLSMNPLGITKDGRYLLKGLAWEVIGGKAYPSSEKMFRYELLTLTILELDHYQIEALKAIVKAKLATPYQKKLAKEVDEVLHRNRAFKQRLMHFKKMRKGGTGPLLYVNRRKVE